jgi:hypothetical protein
VEGDSILFTNENTLQKVVAHLPPIHLRGSVGRKHQHRGLKRRYRRFYHPQRRRCLWVSLRAKESAPNFTGQLSSVSYAPSMNGHFQFRPGSATRRNLPNRVMTATCAVPRRAATAARALGTLPEAPERGIPDRLIEGNL